MSGSRTRQGLLRDRDGDRKYRRADEALTSWCFRLQPTPNPPTLPAMSRAQIAVPLTKAEARRIWLHAQQLDTPTPFGDGPQAVAAAVDHLGYVQIDTINVIERCHHHILWNRIPGYRRADLRHAQSVDKSVFEYWTHALSYVPSKHLRFFVPAMKRHKREGHRWLREVRQGVGADPPRRSADDPRHRRRRAGREGASVGQPQAVKTGASTRLLYRDAYRLRADRHAQNL